MKEPGQSSVSTETSGGPDQESFTSACRPTLATYIGAENLTNTKIGNASETNQS